MNTQTQEALKMAIEAMKWLRMRSPIIYEELEAEKACKEALAQPTSKNIRESFNEMLEDKVEYYKVNQPAQEPVAWMSKKRGDVSKAKMYFNEGEEILPLYTHPAPSWQGLSDDEIIDMYFQASISPQPHQSIINFIRAIEQALKEKNT